MEELQRAGEPAFSRDVGSHRVPPKTYHSRGAHRGEDDGGGGAHGTEEGGVSGAEVGGGRHSTMLSANVFGVVKVLELPATDCTAASRRRKV